MANQNLQNSRVDFLSVRDQDLHGRRSRNASDALLDSDYVTLRQLNKVAASIPAQSTAVPQAAINNRYSLFREGTLGIQSDCCQRSFITSAGLTSLVRVDVKIAPDGADLIVLIYQNAVLWATLTIVDGDTTASGTGASAIAVGNYWRVDITSVGTTFPGSDLTVTIA